VSKTTTKCAFNHCKNCGFWYKTTVAKFKQNCINCGLREASAGHIRIWIYVYICIYRYVCDGTYPVANTVLEHSTLGSGRLRKLSAVQLTLKKPGESMTKTSPSTNPDPLIMFHS